MRLIIPAAGRLSMPAAAERRECLGKCRRKLSDVLLENLSIRSVDDVGLKRLLREAVRVGGNDLRRRHSRFAQLQFEQSRSFIGRIPPAAEDEIAERVRNGRPVINLDALEVVRMRSEDGRRARVDRRVGQRYLVWLGIRTSFAAPMKERNDV